MRILARFRTYVAAARAPLPTTTVADTTAALLQLPVHDAREVVRRFEASLVAEGLRDRPVDQHISCLRAIANEEHGYAWTYAWPARRCREAFNDTLPMELDELEPVLDAAEAATTWKDVGCAALIYLAHYATLRPLEIASLQLGDVAPDARRVWVTTSPPGSPAAARTRDIVQFDDRAAAVLLRYAKLRGPEPGPFITAWDAVRPVTTRTLQRRVAMFGKRAGVDGLNVDTLRDLGIHRALRERELAFVRQLTRHANPHYLLHHYMDVPLPTRTRDRRGAGAAGDEAAEPSAP